MLKKDKKNISNGTLIKVFSDGASRGNPGLAGAGVVIECFGNTHSLSIFLGTKTNNEAEYLALLHAVLALPHILNKELKTSEVGSLKVDFFLDSKLVVEQMCSRWKIKDQRMKVLAEKVRDQLFSLGINYNFFHLEREKNTEADFYANQAIDLATFSQIAF